jgi:recombinational DNA repair ATPase RecF
MTIRRVCIENYRSIESLDLEFSSVNALVGANNSGKSNILRALNIILGETWPSRPFSDKDFFNHDLARDILIQVFFRNALQCEPEVHGFRLRCAAHQSPEFVAIDDNGNVCTYGRGGYPKRVNGGCEKK